MLKALQKDQELVGAWQALAYIYEKQKKSDKQIEAYEKCVEFSSGLIRRRMTSRLKRLKKLNN